MFCLRSLPDSALLLLFSSSPCSGCQESIHLFGQKTCRKKNDPRVFLLPENCLSSPPITVKSRALLLMSLLGKALAQGFILETAIISRGSVLIFPTYKMSDSLKPSTSQPGKKMEVSFFSQCLSPPPFCGGAECAHSGGTEGSRGWLSCNFA